MTRNSISSKNKRGFTLIELAIVMGVIGSIMGAVWWAAGNTREAARDNDAVSELQIVQQNMSNLLAGQTLSLCAGSTTITPCMITAGVIPSNFINASNTTMADNPWSPQNFKIYYTNNKTFRLSFYNLPRRQGCLALLFGATACQSGQIGCPKAAYTNYTAPADSLLPSATTGWQVMTSTQANAMCGDNNYTGSGNSVEFDYPL